MDKLKTDRKTKTGRKVTALCLATILTLGSAYWPGWAGAPPTEAQAATVDIPMPDAAVYVYDSGQSGSYWDHIVDRDLVFPDNLQAAIDEAALQAQQEGMQVEVRVAEGTYAAPPASFTMADGVSITGGYAGMERSGTPSLDQSATILDGKGSRRVFYNSGLGGINAMSHYKHLSREEREKILVLSTTECLTPGHRNTPEETVVQSSVTGRLILWLGKRALPADKPRSVTPDRGKEFSGHSFVTDSLNGLQFYFPRRCT